MKVVCPTNPATSILYLNQSFPNGVNLTGEINWAKWLKTVWKLQNQNFGGKTVGGKPIFWVVGAPTQIPPLGETLSLQPYTGYNYLSKVTWSLGSELLLLYLLCIYIFCSFLCTCYIFMFLSFLKMSQSFHSKFLRMFLVLFQ